MRVLIKGILLVFGFILISPFIFGTENGGAVTLLNTSNDNSTTNNNTSALNGTSQNTTIPNTIDSIPEEDKSGSIASIPILPGKCLGSALCPD
jgi:hypothetical protein